jgi:hypothetical protein
MFHSNSDKTGIPPDGARFVGTNSLPHHGALWRTPVTLKSSRYFCSISFWSALVDCSNGYQLCSSWLPQVPGRKWPIVLLLQMLHVLLWSITKRIKDLAKAVFRRANAFLFIWQCDRFSYTECRDPEMEDRDRGGETSGMHVLPGAQSTVHTVPIQSTWEENWYVQSQSTSDITLLINGFHCAALTHVWDRYP